MTVEAFAEAARRFVTFVEESAVLSAEAFVRDVQPKLIDVYARGMALDHRDPTEDGDPPTSMTTDEWWVVYQRLQRQLGSFDSVVDGSLSDDIADIYRDLRDGFLPYDAGDTDEAIWNWRTEFETHWGRHAAHAIYALHVLRSEYVT